MIFIPITILITIHFEFKYHISEYLPYYDKNYELKKQIKETRQFKALVVDVINQWRIYHKHKNPTKTNLHIIQEKLKLARRQNNKIEPSKLNNEWRMYYEYYYAYNSFICADTSYGNEATNCLDVAQESIRKITKNKQYGTFSENELNTLSLFVAAVHLKLDPPSGLAARKAKELYNNYSDKSQLRLNDYCNDRLIIKILEIAGQECNE